MIWESLERWIRFVLAIGVTAIAVWAMTSMFSRHEFEIALSVLGMAGIYGIVIYALLKL